MDLIADILLAAGALGAGFYCLVLGRRLKQFNNLEQGVGGAVAVLSAQVDDLTKTLAAAQGTASQSATTLTDLATRAEDISRRLELQMASLHDLPQPPEQSSPQPHTEAEPAAPEPKVAQAPPEPDTSEPMFKRRVGA